jgi:hypothetical protein
MTQPLIERPATARAAAGEVAGAERGQGVEFIALVEAATCESANVGDVLAAPNRALDGALRLAGLLGHILRVGKRAILVVRFARF